MARGHAFEAVPYDIARATVGAGVASSWEAGPEEPWRTAVDITAAGQDIAIIAENCQTSKVLI